MQAPSREKVWPRSVGPRRGGGMFGLSGCRVKHGGFGAAGDTTAPELQKCAFVPQKKNILAGECKKSAKSWAPHRSAPLLGAPPFGSVCDGDSCTNWHLGLMLRLSLPLRRLQLPVPQPAANHQPSSTSRRNSDIRSHFSTLALVLHGFQLHLTVTEL